VAAAAAAPRGPTIAWWLAAATLVLAPFVILPGAFDSFRLPQRMVAEWLALASLVPLAIGVARVERPWARLATHPAALALAPLLAVATLSLATTTHPVHVRDALADLWIGAAAVVGWSLGLATSRLRRLLDLLVVPATAMAVLAVLQRHDLWRPLAFRGVLYGDRLEVTSLAGNPADLGLYLVLPCLVVQARLAAGGGRRWAWALAGVCCVYALASTETISAVLALLAGSALFWWRVTPRRRLLVVLAAAIVAVAALVAAVGPLRARVVAKVGELREGRVDDLLTGRLDGWRVAAALLAEHPWAGVGHGAYRAEFARVKLHLLDAGVAFYRRHANPSFVNAHNEILEVGADLGWPGLLALGWALVVAGRAWRRRSRALLPVDSGLLWSGLGALALLCLTQFPFRVGLIAFPWLALLAWGLVPDEATGEAA
jgi:putative inorganic carbon (hco3(-)) transporter